MTRQQRANLRCGKPISEPVSKYQMFNQWFVDNEPWTTPIAFIPGVLIGCLLAILIWNLFISHLIDCK